MSRYPDDRKEQTRERIVRAAARRFLTRGAAGAGIADLMRDARLTHGGFYRHFASKEDLFAEAFEAALDQSSEGLVAAAEAARQGGELKAIIDHYLSPEHLVDVAGGCPVAALAAEVPRQGAGARRAFQRAIRAHLERMSRYVPGKTPAERLQKASMLFSGMAGTLNAARAMGDEPTRRRMLDDARHFYLQAVQT